MSYSKDDVTHLFFLLEGAYLWILKKGNVTVHSYVESRQTLYPNPNIESNSQGMISESGRGFNLSDYSDIVFADENNSQPRIHLRKHLHYSQSSYDIQTVEIMCHGREVSFEAC